MKADKQVILKRIIIIVLIIAFVLALLIYVSGHHLLEGMRVRLLCKTDYQALLKACNKLSIQVAEKKLKPGKYKILICPDPEVSKFPQPILQLKPSYVYVDGDSGRVLIEMLGGLIHFGVCAYPEDFKVPFQGFEYGDKELIPRLWYYDYRYEDNPEYEKIIETLIQKGKKAR